MARHLLIRAGFCAVLGTAGGAIAADECGWAADIRASQYAELQLLSTRLITGQPIREPSFFVDRRLKEQGIALADVVGYRDGDLGRNQRDERALFGRLCLLKFKDRETGETLDRYDCPDDSKLLNLRPTCDGFAACQSIACVPRSDR